MLRRATLLLICALLASTSACSIFHTAPDAPSDEVVAATGSPAPPPLSVVRSTQYTETFELRVDGRHVGYVTEFLEAPMGAQDSRPLPTGSLMVEDLEFRWLGYVDPRGEAFVFDDRDRVQPVGARGRDAQLTAIAGAPGTAVVLVPTFTRS